ncbi:MAG TPA: hypothetical protein VFZ34_11150 [Blastocatellia bacterium]|nr:hypothetical protein [Blastocatellia bacterium]
MKRILSLTLCLFCLNIAGYAQSKFDGVWRINREKSKGMNGQPLQFSYNTLTIERSGDNLSVVQELDDGFYRVLTIKGTTDGREVKTTMVGRPATAWAKLEGDTLKTWFSRETTTNGKLTDREVSRTFTLSADGKTLTAAQQSRLLVREGGAELSKTTSTEVWERPAPAALAEEKKILDLYHELVKGLETNTDNKVILAKHVMPDALVVDPAGMVSTALGTVGGMKPPPNSKVTEEYAFVRLNGTQAVVISGMSVTFPMLPAPVKVRGYFVMLKQDNLWKLAFAAANQDQTQR